MTAAPPTIVLIHGTFHGAWIWRAVKRRLHAMGHEVLTPCLTGSGERHHLASPDVRLETQIADVVNTIDYHGLDRVFLLGHAAAGIVIAGAADRIRGRVAIARLVFFDAKVPGPDDMSFINRRNARAAAFYDGHAARWKDGWQMNFLDSYPIQMLVPDERKDLQDLLVARLTPQPAGPWIDTLEWQGKGIDGLAKTYLVPGAQTVIPTPESFYTPYADMADWDVVKLPVHRDAMLTEPEILADWIDSAARAA